MFVGLFRCFDCGKILFFLRYNNRKSFGVYVCLIYRRFGKGYCIMYYISYEKFYYMILEDINKYLKYVKINEVIVLKYMLEFN